MTMGQKDGGKTWGGYKAWTCGGFDPGQIQQCASSCIKLETHSVTPIVRIPGSDKYAGLRIAKLWRGTAASARQKDLSTRCSRSIVFSRGRGLRSGRFFRRFNRLRRGFILHGRPLIFSRAATGRE